jgi:zinc transport system substrate-binding protein
VAVTVAPLAEIVERVAPGLSDITVLIPPGASPVSYEPSMTSVRAAASADLYVSVGHPAFAWETSWLSGLIGADDAIVIPAAAGCGLIPDDPHVWLDLDCVRHTARRVAAAMQEAHPENMDFVAGSLASFLEAVDDLEAEADRVLAPHRGGSFLVLHPAWGYIAAAHDLQQISILEHGSGDAGPAELAAIVRRARELDLRDVLVQPEFSAEPAMMVASELGGSTVILDPLARDWVASYGRAIAVLAEHVRP